MTDPLDALREPVTPVDPDPEFAAALRDRLRRALLDREGASAVTTAPTTPTAPSPPPTRAEDVPLHTLTAYLAVDGAGRALEFYARAFGARRRGEPVIMEDGRVGHAELAVGDSVLMLADEFPETGLRGPRARGGPSQSLMLRVPDPDAVVDRAVAAGAELERPVADRPYGRSGVVIDPFGHRWMISGVAPVPARTEGHLGYASLWVPDVEATAGVLSAALGWTYTSQAPGHRMVAGAVPHHGIVALSAVPPGLWDPWPRHATLFTSHAVADVDAAAERVRAAGGQAGRPRQEPYGRATDCLDDQGMPFAIYEDGDAVPQAPATPVPGGLAYLTMEVADSARARAFFGAVFGWRFVAGPVPDAWAAEGVRPEIRLHGGHAQATIVPMYAVADVQVAASRVRDHGGTATRPEHHRNGIVSFCADPTGTRFGLGQFT